VTHRRCVGFRHPAASLRGSLGQAGKPVGTGHSAVAAASRAAQIKGPGRPDQGGEKRRATAHKPPPSFHHSLQHPASGPPADDVLLPLTVVVEGPASAAEASRSPQRGSPSGLLRWILSLRACRLGGSHGVRGRTAGPGGVLGLRWIERVAGLCLQNTHRITTAGPRQPRGAVR